MSAKTEMFKVQLQDELPTIGSGHRWVFAREGRKWVFVLDPFTITTTKVRVERWRAVKKEQITCSSHILQYMRQRLDACERPTTAFEKSALAIGE